MLNLPLNKLGSGGNSDLMRSDQYQNLAKYGGSVGERGLGLNFQLSASQKVIHESAS